MSDAEVHPAAGPVPSAPGLTQWQRVSNAFFAPSKTFEDIDRGNHSWWLPYLITVLFSYVLFAGVTMQVGWRQVAENELSMSPTQAERLLKMKPEQRAEAYRVAGLVMESAAAASPITILLMAAIVSALLWGTMNAGFGGRATYRQIFAVNMYAMLPNVIPPILGTAALYAGLAPESFNLRNVAGTNLAWYLSAQDTNRAVYALAMHLDIVTIWVAIVLSIGIAKVAGKNRSAGFIAVFGWWAVWITIHVIGALLIG